jgi:hypothetical protein
MGATDYPCTVDDIRNYLPPGLTINSTSDPSQSHVEAMIVNVTDEINGILRSRGFDLPIDPSLTYALSFLNTACIYGTIARWARTKFPSDTGPGGSKGLAEEYEKKYQSFLSLIELRTLGVPGDDREGAISGFLQDNRPFVRRKTVW